MTTIKKDHQNKHKIREKKMVKLPIKCNLIFSQFLKLIGKIFNLKLAYLLIITRMVQELFSLCNKDEKGKLNYDLMMDSP